ncbi:hypothetical protein ACP275_06G044000 [Erythranthe tilingii]
MADVPPRSYDLRSFGWKMPNICQLGYDCYCHAVSSLVSFELKRRFPERGDYFASPQYLLDHLYNNYPNIVTGYKACTGYVDRFERCAVFDREMCFYGCNGTTALNFLLEKGIPLNSDYPYVGIIQRPPPFSFGEKIKITNIGYVDNLEHAKRIIFAGHPIIAHIDVYTSFQAFIGDGVYKRHVGDLEGGHAVLIMGYDVDDDGDEYFIVLNSWGPNWGQQGYAKVLCSLVKPKSFAHGIFVV